MTRHRTPDFEVVSEYADDPESCRLCGGNYIGVAVFRTATERIAICASCARAIYLAIDPPDPIED